MDIKIEEIHKRLTICVINDMSGDLSDLLDLRDNELYSDIRKYISLPTGSYPNKIIEKNKTRG